ncbi:CalY family protein [Oceanobacillus luteolus]|uniref:TasA family protein n=1 Tax=Oceanobacillus luteolus TaxID=1274358 RepID=A0ABW4HWQ8_9BACI|nr:CalY family protein [Oceanobacillus luteolus]
MKKTKELVTSIFFAMVGLSLIVGGTSAYFTDSKDTNNSFEIGLMELGIDTSSIIQLSDFIPGDSIQSDFELTNEGSIDMKEIQLITSYEIVDHGEPNEGDDLADYIIVELIHQEEKKSLFEKSLSQLNNEPTTILDSLPTQSTPQKFTVRFSFLDNGENQNHFQGDVLNLKWQFEAMQRDGKHKEE